MHLAMRPIPCTIGQVHLLVTHIANFCLDFHPHGAPTFIIEVLACDK